MFKALVYAYVLGGLTFIPLVIGLAIFITIYTSVPVGDPDMAKNERKRLQEVDFEEEKEGAVSQSGTAAEELETNDLPTTRKAWLTMRRTFEEPEDNTSYVTLVRSFLDSKSKDPRRSRPKDMWFVVLKRNILYLYEDEQMTECGAVIELSRHDVLVYPEGLPDGELFARRNAICLRRKPSASPTLPCLTKDMKFEKEDEDPESEQGGNSASKKDEVVAELEKQKETAREEAFDPSTPWFIFVRSTLEMEDWYFALLHAATQPAQTPTLLPLRDVFDPRDMNHLVSTLDDQPDVIPMRWLNALIGRIFFSHYRTQNLEAYIIGRLMKKIEKVKRPQFLTSIAVTEVSVGNRPPMLSKPMLKELSKEGDASLEVHFQYKGEIRITVEATAVINLGARFKSYTVKLVLAVVLKELEGNLLIKVKRPPSNRIWYAFTQTPRMVMEVEPIVSDRQITWGMILSTIEAKIKEVIQESVVMPNMDDIAYFDSLPYEFRGGIWSDASQHSRPKHSQPTPPDMADDANSVASAPAAMMASQTTDHSAPRSLPEEVVPTKSSSSSSQETDLPLVVVEDDPTDSTRNNNRRRSWFSSVRSDDGNSTLSALDFFAPQSEGSAADTSRGRKDRSDKGSHRQGSRSRPGSVRSTRSNKSTTAVDQDVPASETHSLRRSLSRHFNRENNEAQLGGEGSSSDTRQAKSNPTTPLRKPSNASQQKRSPSPPSFFSTLKSKAGDKQALSNTAKEAMRKWGVNWGAKREGAGTPPSGNEDLHDGPSSSRLGVTNDSQGHKQRASYAEVRAAVAGRKEKEKVSEQDGNLSSSPPSTSDRASTSNVASSSRATLSTGTSNGESLLNPSIVAAAARLSTPRLALKKSTPSISRVNTDVDAEETAAPETLIHVQPQAKMMSIPGIHASHRGEIQALGYVAPQPAAPPAMKTLESTLKNPAIQTVYRFWRSPSISNPASNQDSDGPSRDNQTAGAGASAPSSSSQTANVEVDGSNKDVASNSHLTPQPAERPTPPPLPPRSIPVPGHSRSASLQLGTPPEVSQAPSPSGSPASKALKNIVSKDETTRTQQQQQLQEQPNIQHEVPEPVSEEGIGQSILEKPLVEGALNATRHSSDTDSVGNGHVRSASGRTPPPLPPRRSSVQVLAS